MARAQDVHGRRRRAARGVHRRRRGWGLLHINRAGGSSRFTDEEVAFVEAIAPLVGRGRVVSATPEALAWFEEIESVYKLPDPVLGLDVPSEVTVAAQVARGRAAVGASTGPTRTRARTRSGVWLLIHASWVRAADGTAAHAAVVIEPAKASEVAPLIVDAYELTPREVDVTRALGAG